MDPRPVAIRNHYSPGKSFLPFRTTLTYLSIRTGNLREDAHDGTNQMKETHGSEGEAALIKVKQRGTTDRIRTLAASDMTRGEAE